MIDFTRYRTTDRTCRAYIADPAEMYTVERCRMYDQIAERYMQDMRAELELMQQYRKALFDRMQLLYSTPYHLRLTLKRARGMEKVYYYLLLEKVFDGSGILPELLSNTKYAGKDRAKAIADFKAECKRRPGIDSVIDIEKKGWER